MVVNMEIDDMISISALEPVASYTQKQISTLYIKSPTVLTKVSLKQQNKVLVTYFYA